MRHLNWLSSNEKLEEYYEISKYVITVKVLQIKYFLKQCDIRLINLH